MKKLLAVGVIVLFLGVSVIPSTGTTDVKQITVPTSNGNTLYVGGSGPGNYTKIQDAIDNASDGDTVFVYNDSSPYYEHNITVDKSINLVGENRDTTVIDGGGKGSVIIVTAHGVNISGFTIQNGGWGDDEGGINSFSNYNKFYDNNVINNNEHGICLNAKWENWDEEESNHNSIYLNTIKNNGHAGITIVGDYYTWQVKFRYNKIYDNIVSNNGKGGIAVGLQGCCNNKIYKNQINSNNNYGIYVRGDFNTIIGNNITNHNEYGIKLALCSGTLIKKNNFIDNDCNAFFINSFANRWVRNYWDDRLGFRPEIIKGVLYTFPLWGPLEEIPWRNFDWRPAQEPYDIGV